MKAFDRQTVDLLRAVVLLSPERTANYDADIAASVSCWQETIAAAQQHGVLPMLYSRLTASGSPIPASALELLRREYERNAFHCLANAAELLEVLKAFQTAGIAVMPFKGVVLGASAYGEMTARNAGDLDLLIFARDLQCGTEILKQRGYTLTTNVREDGTPEAEDHFEYHFERAADGMVLELRWRLDLTQPRFRRVLGMDWVWPRRRTIELAGMDVPSLDPVSALLVLCMHGSKHGWSRLMWICDVAALLRSEPDLDWVFARQEAKRVGLWRCLALGVLLANRVAGADVPPNILASFQADGTARKLAAFFEKHVLEQPGRIPEGRVPYNIGLLGFWDRTSLMLSPTFLRPNSRDRAAVTLPKRLDVLYYLVRPIRLLLDRSSR